MDNSANMLQLCRLCLVKDEVNIPIFEEQGDIRQIFLKISSCLPVKVSREDKLPKKICDGCSCKLDMLYEFWNTSANAEKQLLSWLGEAGMSAKMNDGHMSAVAQQIKPNETFVKEEELDPSDLQKEGDDEDEDDEEKSYMFQQKLEENNAGPSATATSNEEEEQEQPPPKRARRTAAVKAAIAMDHDSDDDDDSGEPLTKVEDESEDSDCEDAEPAFVDAPSTSADDQPGPSGVGKDGADAPLKRRKNLTAKSRKKRKNLVIKIERDRSVSPKLENGNENHIKFACEVCDEKLDSSVAFAIHSAKHSYDNKYHCHYCTFKSTLVKRMRKHMNIHGNIGKYYQCEVCKQEYPECIQAIEHKNFHSGEMPYKCESCEKHFMFSWLLFTHRRLFHWNEKPDPSSLSCEVCNMNFRTRSGLRKHNFRKHSKSPKVPPLCDICGKCLASNETLKFHKRTHTGEKPHTCQTCGKSFCKKGLLIEHERIHTGEKPFGCPYCEKAFAQRAPLKIHQRIHTGERPYVCRWCGKGCICKSVLDSHMKSCNGVIIP